MIIMGIVFLFAVVIDLIQPGLGCTSGLVHMDCTLYSVAERPSKTGKIVSKPTLAPLSLNLGEHSPTLRAKHNCLWRPPLVRHIDSLSEQVYKVMLIYDEVLLLFKNTLTHCHDNVFPVTKKGLLCYFTIEEPFELFMPFIHEVFVPLHRHTVLFSSLFEQLCL